MRGDVRREVLVHKRCVSRERFLQIDDGVDRIDLYDNISNRILGNIAALRDDHRDWLADMADFVLRKRQLRTPVKYEIRNRRRRYENRPRLQIRAEIRRSVNSVNAGPLQGGRDINAR